MKDNAVHRNNHQIPTLAIDDIVFPLRPEFPKNGNNRNSWGGGTPSARPDIATQLRRKRSNLVWGFISTQNRRTGRNVVTITTKTPI
jgi:hypothetical protein